MVKLTQIHSCLSVFDHFVGLGLKRLEAKFGDDLLVCSSQQTFKSMTKLLSNILAHFRQVLHFI